MSELCPPTWSTKRTPGRKSLIDRYEFIGNALFPGGLLPWQRHVLEIGSELREDGRPAYREVNVVVPRQSGKSISTLAVLLERCIWPGRSVGPSVYSAQTGTESKRKMNEDFWPLIDRSPMGQMVVQRYRSADRTQFLFESGSWIHAMIDGGKKAGHGMTSVQVTVFDEAWSDTDESREQGLLPPMVTVPSAQLWVVSTAGTEQSNYLRRKVDLGRELVEKGDNDGVAYFEWSAEEGSDPDDPAVWAKCMPALGLTVDSETIRHIKKTMTGDQFRRAFLNQWVLSDAPADPVIPGDKWALANSMDVSPVGVAAIGVHANVERTWGTIAISDEQGQVEVVEYKIGTHWLVDRAVELSNNWEAPVAVAHDGPIAGADWSGLEVKDRLHKLNVHEACASAGQLYDGIVSLEGLPFIRAHGALDNAVAGTIRKVRGGSWVWGPFHEGVDVSPLWAAGLARWKALSKRSGFQVFDLAALAASTPPDGG